jgi:transcription-repair coupling factor (superfamily II helicase)
MSKPLPHPPLPTTPKQRRYWTPPDGSARALLIAETARSHAGLVVAVTRDTQRARALEDELRVFGGTLPVLHFPDWETLPYDVFSPHPEIVSQRIATLYQLPTIQRGVLVVPVATLMQRIAPRSHITGAGLVLDKGQKLDLAHEQRRLEASGYRHVPQVAEPGDFAVRGALIDIYPMGSDEPYRIELFDDEVESIRSFDPESQRSQQQVEKIELLPAREFPLTDASAKAFRSNLRERFPIDVRRCPLYQDIKEGVTPGGIEYYLPLFFEQTATLFDYLADDALFVLGEGVGAAADQFWTQTAERYDQRAHDIERPVLPPTELYLPPEQWRAQLNKRLRVEVVEPGHEHAVSVGTQPAPDVPLNRKGEEPGTSLRHFLASYKGRVLIAADSAGRREALIETLAAAGLKPENVESWQAFLGADAPAPSPPTGSGERGLVRASPSPSPGLNRVSRSPSRRPPCSPSGSFMASACAASATASAAAAPRAIRTASSAISPSSRSARRSCTSITAWAATRAWCRWTWAEWMASSSPSNTPRATSCMCPWRNWAWSAATPAPRRNWRRCIRWAVTRGNARARKLPKRCATWRPSCWRSTPSARPAAANRCRSTGSLSKSSAAPSRSRKRPTRKAPSKRC